MLSSSEKQSGWFSLVKYLGNVSAVAEPRTLNSVIGDTADRPTSFFIKLSSTSRTARVLLEQVVTKQTKEN